MTFNDVVQAFLNKYSEHGDKDALRVLKRLTADDKGVFDEFALLGLRRAVSAAIPREPAPSRAEYARKRKQQIQERTEYASKHNIPLDEVSNHKIGGHMAAFNRLVDEESTRRAISILDAWKVNGTPLLDCSTTKLRQAQAECRHIAATETRNGDFYGRLATIVPEGKTVREAPREEVLTILRETLPDE